MTVSTPFNTASQDLWWFPPHSTQLVKIRDWFPPHSTQLVNISDRFSPHLTQLVNISDRFPPHSTQLVKISDWFSPHSTHQDTQKKRICSKPADPLILADTQRARVTKNSSQKRKMRRSGIKPTSPRSHRSFTNLVNLISASNGSNLFRWRKKREREQNRTGFQSVLCFFGRLF